MDYWERLPICRCLSDGMIRYGALVWQTEEGILWIEPHYLDPMACCPALHVAEGEPCERGDAVLCGGWEFRGASEQEIDDAQRWWLEQIGGDIEKERANLEQTVPELIGEMRG